MAIRKIKLPNNSVVAINDDRLDVTSPSNGQTIVYNSATGKFVNTTMPELVTSISSSSTDSQYPSAKCMYDIIGDVETLLAALL